MQELERARYVSLATFRRTGEAVATPVWAAFDDGSWYVFSAGNAGKIKRLRNSRRIRLATCDARGRLLGDWHDGHGFILEDATDIRRALAALRTKYGVQMWVADTAARLSGRFSKRAYIRVALTDGRDAEPKGDPQCPRS